MARAIWIGCLIAIGLGLPGCHRRPPASPAVPPFAATPSDIAIAPPDAIAEPDTLASSEPSPVRPAPPIAAAAPDTAIAAPDSSAAPAVVTVNLSRAEKLRLEAAAREDLVAVRSILDGLDRERLSESDMERVRTVESLLDSARERLAVEDVQAAASLAHKARLLAEEMVGK